MAHMFLEMGTPRPTSYEVEPGSEFMRGQIGFILPNGKLTSKVTNTGSGELAKIAGLIDDDKVTTLEDKLIASYTAVATTDSSGDVQVDFVTGLVDRITTTLAAGTTLADLPSWSAQYKLSTGGTYANCPNTSTVSINNTTGVITLGVSGLTANTSYTFKINIVVNVKRTLSGALVVSDMYNNDSTLASGKATVHFLPGIYSTDMYDPLALYTINAPLYVRTDGLITANDSDSLVITGVDGNKIVIGVVERVPLPSYTTDTRLVYGHKYTYPELLVFRYLAPAGVFQL